MPLPLVTIGYGNTCPTPVLALLSVAACFLISAAWAAEPTDTSHIQGDRGDCDIKDCWHAYVSQLGTRSAGQELIWSQSLDKP